MLLDYYDSRNKVIDSGKIVSYTCERVFGSWTYKSGAGQWITYNQAWKYIRTCTKTYLYVGMDYDTAQECVSAMKNYYKRSTIITEWQEDGEYAGQFINVSGGVIPMADVTMENFNNSKMYNVRIVVNENDEKWALQQVTPSLLFTTENQREYD